MEFFDGFVTGVLIGWLLSGLALFFVLMVIRGGGK